MTCLFPMLCSNGSLFVRILFLFDCSILCFKDDGGSLFFGSSTYMVVALKVFELVEFARLAVSSNLFGLGCPFYCGPSTLPSLLLFLILGFALGFLTCLAIICYLYRYLAAQGFPQPFSAEARPAVSGRLRLQGYSL